MADPMLWARSLHDEDRDAVLAAEDRRSVAEFVTDQDTLELLAELGVDLAQGFHIGRPRPLEEL
jgi:predicted signal transduction protein with EAL and GGDEF domain